MPPPFPPWAYDAELWRRDTPSGVTLDARAIGFRNFQSFVVLFDNDDDELFCVGLCDFTEWKKKKEKERRINKSKYKLDEKKWIRLSNSEVSRNGLNPI